MRLCQLVFGGGFAGRALFTNDERSVIHAQRPVILSGIDELRALGGPERPLRLLASAADRSRPAAAPRTSFGGRSTRTVRGSWGPCSTRSWAACASCRRSISTELPRMADYAKWGEAVGRGLGWGPGTFLSTYNDNRKDATEPELEGSPIGNLMLWTARRTANWSGTPARLLAKLTGLVSKKEAASARWPKTPRELSNELRRIAPQLALHGLTVDFVRFNAERVVKLTSVCAPRKSVRFRSSSAWVQGDFRGAKEQAYRG